MAVCVVRLGQRVQESYYHSFRQLVPFEHLVPFEQLIPFEQVSSRSYPWRSSYQVGSLTTAALAVAGPATVAKAMAVVNVL